MAIARTASGQIGASVGVTGLSGAFNCSGGDILIAFAERQNANVQTCTYNGASMTLAGTSAAGASSLYIDVFYIVAPASGSNTLASSGSGSTYRALHAIAYSGAKQTGQPDASSFPTGTGTGTSKTTSVTTVAANSWIAGIFYANNGGTVTANNSAVKIGSTFSNPGAVDMLWDTNGPVVTPASTTVGGQSTVSGGLGLAAISIAPVASPTGPTTIKTLNGVSAI